ncbi:MAG: hypothetical protein QOI95_3176 [Acidimicrobiaceae bacterium]|jgi:hypothetical protein
MPVVALLIFVSLLALSWALWITSIRLAADLEQVQAPDGRWYDVLANREGVMLYTRSAAYLNAYSVLPTAIALLRHRVSGKPWRWSVIVRPSPFRGYKDLLHELYADRETAGQRVAELSQSLERGVRSWPEEAEWFR